MNDNKLIGISGNARDLMDYIQLVIKSNEYNKNTRFYIHLNVDFKINYLEFLSKNNIVISIPTINRAIKELKDKYVLLPTKIENGKIVKTKGRVLYNFKDFAYIGNMKDYDKDVQKYKINEILDVVKTEITKNNNIIKTDNDNPIKDMIINMKILNILLTKLHRTSMTLLCEIIKDFPIDIIRKNDKNVRYIISTDNLFVYKYSNKLKVSDRTIRYAIKDLMTNRIIIPKNINDLTSRGNYIFNINLLYNEKEKTLLLIDFLE